MCSMFSGTVSLMFANSDVTHLQNFLQNVAAVTLLFLFLFFTFFLPLPSMWPHLRCDVGLEAGNIDRTLPVEAIVH